MPLRAPRPSIGLDYHTRCFTFRRRTPLHVIPALHFLPSKVGDSPQFFFYPTNDEPEVAGTKGEKKKKATRILKPGAPE